ncbi:MAG: DUF924 domain-containing protein [Myxococcales bacterium]|nr:DUF924 domain-containing protein [Myxococcales bacterium]MCB9708192.1 DUF924 domain-containing protein [Myxococcales bacterium]
MTTGDVGDIEGVLKEWFGTLSPDGRVQDDVRERWWQKDPTYDAHLRDRWGKTLASARQGELDAWEKTPRGALALVIVLDQWSRNIHRGSSDMFAADTQARAVAKRALAQGHHLALPHELRSFFYLPLMHSENVDDQSQCVALFKHLVADSSGPLRENFLKQVDFAERHRDIIEKFGRFPHRNATLGRTSTAEEEAFLKEPGSSF